MTELENIQSFLYQDGFTGDYVEGFAAGFRKCREMAAAQARLMLDFKKDAAVFLYLGEDEVK